MMLLQKSRYCHVRRHWLAVWYEESRRLAGMLLLGMCQRVRFVQILDASAAAIVRQEIIRQRLAAMPPPSQKRVRNDGP